MAHKHYLALVEFHVIGDDNVVTALKQKLRDLSDCDDIGLKNNVPTFEKV